MTALTLEAILGPWELTAWEMRLGEALVRPLGDRPEGILYYAADGWMAVQISAPGRPTIASPDPLGGTERERAAAYASSLAYCGTYELRGDHVLHRVRLSTFPNWTRRGASSVRPSGRESAHPSNTPDRDARSGRQR